MAVSSWIQRWQSVYETNSRRSAVILYASQSANEVQYRYTDDGETETTTYWAFWGRFKPIVAI